MISNHQKHVTKLCKLNHADDVVTCNGKYSDILVLTLKKVRFVSSHFSLSIVQLLCFTVKILCTTKNLPL